jgi:F-type H+-transporting ATPase subunit epsilon
MAEIEFKVQVVTSEKIVFSKKAVSVILPGESGYLGVLANHAPLVSALGKGNVTIRTLDGGEHRLYVENGFFEVFRNEVSIFADLVKTS